MMLQGIELMANGDLHVTLREEIDESFSDASVVIPNNLVTDALIMIENAAVSRLSYL